MDTYSKLEIQIEENRCIHNMKRRLGEMNKTRKKWASVWRKNIFIRSKTSCPLVSQDSVRTR